MHYLLRRFCNTSARRLNKVHSEMGDRKLPWKDSASLIIASPQDKQKKASESLAANSSDYDILFLKRVSKSSFFPNAYVFPGGGIDDADKSPQWFKLFEKADSKFIEKVPQEFFVKQDDGLRSPLFPGDVASLRRGILPNEIAFRICAIRESFEESGVLLLTDDAAARRTHPDAIHARSVSYLLNDRAVEEWRTKVHEDAQEFINLCFALNCVPDIWSLKEWFEWLTPKVPGKRYDTIFYSCCLKESPKYSAHDGIEMTESLWLTPAEMLLLYSEKKAVLAPPQIFELMRLLNFSSLKELHSYTNERALKGLRRWIISFALTKDGKKLSIFPGDDLYPDDPDELGTKTEIRKLDKTHDELINSNANLFNYISGGPLTYSNSSLVRNVEMDYGLIPPFDLKKFALIWEKKSKL